jgi:hypothetical protein
MAEATPLEAEAIFAALAARSVDLSDIAALTEPEHRG